MSPATLPGYAELHCVSNFSFLRGASHAEELVARAHLAAREAGIQLIVGTELLLADGLRRCSWRKTVPTTAIIPPW